MRSSTLYLVLIFTVFAACKSGSNEPDIDLSTCENISVVVENMPELVGGLAGLQERKVYPEVAIRAGIEGRVTVEFVVNKSGKAENAKVIKGIGGGCDEEALRLVNTAEFKPATQRGIPTCTRMSLPVLFKLPQD